MTIPENWNEQARYDLDTAKAMLDSGRYLYVLFCCQQAVEKAIKSVIALRTKKMPPRIHNLIRLAEKAGLEVEESRAEQFRLLTNYYIQSRYPGEIENLSSAADRTLAEEVVHYTEDILLWLSILLK